MKRITDKNITQECWFKAVRSSGKGGQNVNKVATKVEIWFSIDKSTLLTPQEKKVLLRKLQNKLVGNNCLRITCQASRSQLANKKQALQKLTTLLNQALVKKKKRIPTKIPKAIKAAILEQKKRQSAKKALRKKVTF